MAESNEKEFHIDNNFKTDIWKTEPIIAKVRKATEKEGSVRKKYLSELKEKFTSFILFSRNSGLLGIEWDIQLKNSKFINDKYNRMELSREAIKKDVICYDVSLSLVGCNLKYNDERPYFTFKNGRVNNKNFCSAWRYLPIRLQEDIYKKVIEVNPSWNDEAERITASIATEFGVKQLEGNFFDLSLNPKSNPKSAFIKSREFILSLIEEINQTVFESNGVIKINMGINELVGLREVIPTPNNIILVLSKKRVLNTFLEGYIGIVEHGNFEIKIVAKRSKSIVWDSDINNIVNGLRNAIKWWKEEGLYTEEEAEALANAENPENYPGAYSEFSEDD